MTTCVRMNCDHTGHVEAPLFVPGIFEREKADCVARLCQNHSTELEKIVGSSSNDKKLFTCEIDEKMGTIDYFSLQKTAKKQFERVLSVRPIETSSFQIVQILLEGSDVSATKMLLETLPKGASPYEEDDKENIIPGNGNVESRKRKFASVVTPMDESFSKGPSVLVDIAHLIAFRTAFFSSPASSLVIEDDRSELRIRMHGIDSLPSPSPNLNLNLKPKAQIKPILLSIEGNIGAGKSYLLKSLRERNPNWQFIDEPVDFWQSLKNEDGKSLLEVFYADQRRWSYTFQNCALLSRYNNIETSIKTYGDKFAEKHDGDAEASQRPTPVIFITERCLDTDHQVFAKMLASDKMLGSLEFDLYQRWFKLLEETATPLSAIVFVDTVPETCSSRISMRGRNGEEGIPLAYLQSLDKFQRAWVDSTHVPVVRVESSMVENVEDFVGKLILDARKS